MAEYIEREAILKCVAEDGYYCEYDLGYWSHNAEFQELIKEIPAADVKPVVRGKWVLDTIYPSGVKKFRCSVCGQDRTVHEKYEGIFRQNYCPNCGADMRGHTDEES